MYKKRHRSMQTFQLIHQRSETYAQCAISPRGTVFLERSGPGTSIERFESFETLLEHYGNTYGDCIVRPFYMATFHLKDADMGTIGHGVIFVSGAAVVEQELIPHETKIYREIDHVRYHLPPNVTLVMDEE